MQAIRLCDTPMIRVGGVADRKSAIVPKAFRHNAMAPSSTESNTVVNLLVRRSCVLVGIGDLG